MLALTDNQLRQLGEAAIRRVVAGEQLAHGTAAGLILAVDEGERLFVGVAHDETRGGLPDGPRS